MKNNKLFILIIVLFVLFNSCISSKKHYQRGEYDIAIRKSVKKLHKNPNRQKEVLILEKSFNIANQKDNERIIFLKKESKPDSWDEILRRYKTLKTRQDVIRPILPLKIGNKEVPIKIINYDNEIIEAKQNAAEFYYAHAQKLLNTNDRFQSRQAYNELSKVKLYFPVYKDTESLLSEAYNKGQTNALIMINNRSIYKLPQPFYDDMLSISLSRINSHWIKYYTKNDPIQYHNKVVLNINNIGISPERLSEKQTIFEKKVEDGWEYLLDANQNTVKDSLGNAIKVPRMIKISCKYIELVQQKTIRIEGSVDYINLSNNQIMRAIPLASDYFFENIAATAIGDLRALNKEQREMVGKPPIPFPPDIEMIAGGSQIFKKIFHDILFDNRYYIK